MGTIFDQPVAIAGLLAANVAVWIHGLGKLLEFFVV
jgi:hypothetical protein